MLQGTNSPRISTERRRIPQEILDPFGVEDSPVEKTIRAKRQVAAMSTDRHRGRERPFQLHAGAGHRQTAVGQRPAENIRPEDGGGPRRTFRIMGHHAPTHQLRIDPQRLAAPGEGGRFAREQHEIGIDDRRVAEARHDPPRQCAQDQVGRLIDIAGVGQEIGERLMMRRIVAPDGRPGERAQQIALNLERLRWTPLTEAQRMIVVNIPEFVLRAYEVREGRIVVHQTMKIIVGKAMDTRTPVFEEEMRSIEFSPYWNVPQSIARSETVPKLQRDPGYLAREDMEFVLPDGLVSTEVTPYVLAEVLAGRARIRQRPGPKNALGAIKFSFPNRDHIYLHHTPAAQLFGKGRRDFSHGCVRVEQPVELALFVLQDMPQWNEQRVREAMAAGQLQAVRLATPVPVLITYGTALVKQGRLHFYPDIYGHDRELAEALRQR